MNSLKCALLAAVAGIGLVSTAHAAPFVLTNGAADGQVSVGVDGFGSFGSSISGDASDAIYNPVGAGTAAGTTFESFIALRIGGAGTRTVLSTDTGLGGSATNPTVSGTATSGSSSFLSGGLNFSLTQTLVNLMDGSNQVGTRLDQTYRITNTATSGDSLTFELLRYIDGDLLFDGSIADGGGRIGGALEILFETDSATGTADATTFVGITASGGSAAGPGRFEIDSFSGLRGRVIAGTALDDTITNDGADADQFVDAGLGYDVTLAFRNIFTLAPGASVDYITQTIFGSGAPEDFQEPDPNPVPEPAGLAMMAFGLFGLAAMRRRRR